MKLLFASTFLALTLFQTQTTAFTPINNGQKISRRVTTNLNMVGFRDPRQRENREAMQKLAKLDSETKRVKKWLNELMEPEESDAETGAAVEDSAEEVGLLGGSIATTTMPTVKLPSYKPSLRSDLGKIVMVTGTYHPSILRALNNNDFGSRDTAGGGESGDLIPNFQFEKIILSIQGEEGAKEAKKRVISREARYSGLLNKLVIEAEEGSMPAKERMEGVSSWVVRLEAGETADMLPKVAELAKGATALKHVIVIVEGVDSMAGTVEGWDALMQEGNSFQSTLLAVGDLYDEGGAGRFYHIGNFMGDDNSSIEFTNADATAPKMLRSDAYLTLANLLALNVSSNKAFGAYEFSSESIATIHESIPEKKKMINEEDKELVDAPEDDEWKSVKYANRLVRAMREAGFSRLAELDVMLARGVDGYIEFLNSPPKRSKTSEQEKSKWDQIDDEIMARFEKSLAESEAKRALEEEAKMENEIKLMAREWCVRQYTLKALGDYDPDEELDYIYENWEDALEEGRKLYQMVNSEKYEENMKNRLARKQLFIHDDLDPQEIKKRELILEKVAQKYIDAYAGDDLGVEEGASDKSLAGES